MKIRRLTESDKDEVLALHDMYYGHQFDRPEFWNTNYLSAFVIEENDKLIMAGGVRPIAETILVTDKDANRHTIGKALIEALRFSKFTCKNFNVDLLHAFVADENYQRHLIRWGFQKRPYQALFMKV